MPIEVRELVIKATVVQEGANSGTTAASGSNNAVSSNEEIIKACIEKVMEILKEKLER